MGCLPKSQVSGVWGGGGGGGGQGLKKGFKNSHPGYIRIQFVINKFYTYEHKSWYVLFQFEQAGGRTAPDGHLAVENNLPGDHIPYMSMFWIR